MRLVELLFELTVRWRRWEEEFADQNALTPGMVWVLVRLDSTESVCAKNLASRINLSLSRSSRLIEQMVGLGLLHRESDPSDRRRCTLRLSETGAKIRDKLMLELDFLQRQLQEEGQFCDWEKLMNLMDKLSLPSAGSV